MCPAVSERYKRGAAAEGSVGPGRQCRSGTIEVVSRSASGMLWPWKQSGHRSRKAKQGPHQRWPQAPPRPWLGPGSADICVTHIRYSYEYHCCFCLSFPFYQRKFQRRTSELRQQISRQAVFTTSHSVNFTPSPRCIFSTSHLLNLAFCQPHTH